MSDYQHDNLDKNLTGLQNALKYDADGEPVLRVSIEKIEDNAGTLNVSGAGGSGPSNVTVDNFPATQTVDGNVTVDNFPATQTVDGNVTVDGTVNIGTMPEVEISNDVGNPIPVTGTLSSTPSAGQGSDLMSRIDIASGIVTGHGAINKFGRRNVPAHLTNYYSISAQGEYDFPDNTDTATVTSSNGGQDNGGTVEVAGLDANYNPVTETITVGQSGTQQFLRVHRAKMVTAGAGNDVNEGNITVEVDGETVAYIPEGYGQTMQAIYTVPAGYTAYIFQVDVGVDEKEKPVHARIQTRDAVLANASWQTKAFIVMESNYISHNQTIPISVPEKHDIVLQANSTSGDIEISGGFELVLREN